MASDYKRYFPFLWKEAQVKGLNRTEFMGRCGMPKQSFTKYDRGQGITAPTMVNLMEGLDLSIEKLEKKSVMRLTKSEKKDLTDAQWNKAHALEIAFLRTHPEELENIRQKALSEH